jgi:adenylate kinase
MIILLGVPGSGKSTQGQFLTDRGNVKWISMGEILRNKANQSQKQRMQKGELLDSQETIGILIKELKEVGDKPELVLDGFPRTIEQSKWLIEHKQSGFINVTALIHLYADEKVVEKRLMARGRADDTPETIYNRFKIYQQTFQPIIGLLKEAGVPILEINADQTPELILHDIIKALELVGIEA